MSQNTRFLIYILIVIFLGIFISTLSINLVFTSFPTDTYKTIVKVVSITSLTGTVAISIASIVDYSKGSN
jgi:hypothetical protein